MQGYAQQYAREISTLLWKVPREVLLLLKTNDCLRSVDLALGQVSTLHAHCGCTNGSHMLLVPASRLIQCVGAQGFGS